MTEVTTPQPSGQRGQDTHGGAAEGHHGTRARQEQHAPGPDVSHVDSHGAVDLSQAAHPASAATEGGGDAPTVRLDVPLIAQSDEAGFEDTVATSRTVPVVVALWSSRSLAARGALGVLEELTRQYAGRFQLVEIDADTSPQIAQAFQVQTLPTVVALVGGRPVPLFQGSPVREQVVPVLDELLKVASQMGVTGGVAVTAQDTKAPTPEEHLPALAAEKAGDLDGAIAAWEKAVERNPRDEDAKAHLARVRIQRRSRDEGAGDDPQALADRLFSQGDRAGAFDLLLGVVGGAQDPDVRDQARVRLLDLFRVAGNTDEVRAARRRLSTLLMV